MISTRKASPIAVIAAFATVYLVWGSTYLAIRYAIESLPPFLMAGLRFGIAGLLLLVYSLLSRAPKPSRSEGANAALVGILMLSIGNAAVSWAETRIDSGIAALLVATVAIWILLLNWLTGEKAKPTLAQTAGLLLGFCGIGLLVLPTGASALGKNVDAAGAGAVVLGALSWAAGTLYARYRSMPKSPWVTNGTQMFAAGVLLVLGSLISGEAATTKHLSTTSIGSLAYLIVFGSIVAFSAYTWLNTVTTPARLSTYAYVNPVVAVLLGSVVAHEAITLRSVIAMSLIIGAVFLLSVKRKLALAVVKPALDSAA